MKMNRATSFRLLLAALTLASAPAALAKKHRKKPAPTPETAAPAADDSEEESAASEVAAAPESVSPPPSAPDLDAVTSFGLVLEPSGGELKALAVLPGSWAEEVGFKTGDAVLRLDGAAMKTAADAAAALRGWAPHARLSAVVRRDLAVVDLQSSEPRLKPPPVRAVAELTPREADFQSKQMDAAKREAPDVLRRLPAPRIDISAGQTFWISFPKGIPASVKADDVLEAETNTPVVTDPNLDFLAIPPHSPAWLQVLSVDGAGPTTTLRLHLYKIRLAGGHTYGCSGIATDVSGDQVLTRVSPGGTLATAAASVGKPPMLVTGEARFKVRLQAPLTLFEGPAFYRAGPGLWLRAKGGADDRVFEVSQVVPARSAAITGLGVGDLITSIQGASTSKMELRDAMDKLYGEPGSKAELRVRRGGASREESATLIRGAAYEPELGLKIAAGKDALEITEVAKGSPADKAGVKPGDRIVKIGTLEATAIPGEKVQQIFKGDLTEENAVTIQHPGSADRQVQIPRGWTRVPLPPPYKP